MYILVFYTHLRFYVHVVILSLLNFYYNYTCPCTCIIRSHLLGSELVSRGTNTSITQSSVEQEEKTKDRERLQKAFETIELLKRELEICQVS